MDNNNSSNTGLLIVIIIILIAGAFWLLSDRGVDQPDQDIEISVPDIGGGDDNAGGQTGTE